MSRLSKEDADAALANAIREHAEAYDMESPDDYMLGDYVITAHWFSFNKERPPSYTNHQSQSRLPRHVTLGLYEVGMSMVEEYEPDGEID